MRAGIAAQLQNQPDLEVCGEAADAAETRTAITKLEPDAVVLDLMLGDDDGLSLIREIRHMAPKIRIVVLSMTEPAIYKPRALAAGADAFVPKTASVELTVAALRGELKNTSNPPMATGDDAVERLSDRELQVFRLIAQGRTTREISSALGISPRTVDAHKEHIKSRLGIANSTQLATRAANWLADTTR